MLADRIDFVLGVDTHKQSHTAAAVTPTGGLVTHLTVTADAAGCQRLLAFADEHAPGRRIWAIEGTGSFGAGLTTHLLEHGEWVVEIDRPKRPARRNGAKTDELDAVRAAREALAREHLAQPRRRGPREALRVLLTTRENAMRARTKAICQLKDLVVCAPESLRRPLHALPTTALVQRCARLRSKETDPVEQRYTILALQTTARRALALETEAAELEAQLEPLVQQAAPMLLDEPGIGPVSAAQLLCSWSHAGRLRSEAAFAALAGVAPIPASGAMTYDPRRLRLHGLIQRLGGTFRYTVTADGLHLAFGLSRLYARLLQPTWAALLAPSAELPPTLRQALVHLDAALAQLCSTPSTRPDAA